MDQKAFSRLERQIEALLQEYERQKQHNFKLREKQEQLISERSVLKAKLEVATKKIKDLIQHLKSIEREYERSR